MLNRFFKKIEINLYTDTCMIAYCFNMKKDKATRLSRSCKRKCTGFDHRTIFIK